MSTAIQTPVGIVLGGHQNCSNPADPWYKGEKDFLLDLKRKYFDPIAKELSKARELVEKTDPGARSRAQAAFDKMQRDVETEIEHIKSLEEDLYDEFELSGCMYTNSGYPTSIFMRGGATDRANRAMKASKAGLAEVQRIQQQNPYKPTKAQPKPKAPQKQKKPQAKRVAKPKPKPKPKPLGPPSPAVKACMEKAGHLISRGMATRAGFRGGIRMHCERVAGAKKPAGFGNIGGTGKHLLALGAVIAAIGLVLWMRSQ